MYHCESVCTVVLQELVGESLSVDMFRPRGLPSASLSFFLKGDFCRILNGEDIAFLQK